MKLLLFRIDHGDWSATLQVPDDSTLETLARLSIEAVGFDFDHCYGFYDNLTNPYRSEREYTLFADIGEDAKEDDPGVENTPVATVFEPGSNLVLLFDYGDDWLFLVTCTGAVESSSSAQPKLLSTSGTPPQQYRNPEEDGECE